MADVHPRWLVALAVTLVLIQVTCLSGPNVCMVKQKYNITKRVKYRAPMSIRTYEWCLSMPPRCSKWTTEMRDLTRLETEERTAEMAVCCPGFKMLDISCVPICPSGKTGHDCLEDCPPNKWGPSCMHECLRCRHGVCSSLTGECECQDGWQGESCEISMSTTPSMMDQLLTTAQKKYATKSTKPSSTPQTTNPTIPSTPTTQTIPVTIENPIKISTTFTNVDKETKTDATSQFTTIKPTSYITKSITPEDLVKNTEVSRENTKSIEEDIATEKAVTVTIPPDRITTEIVTKTTNKVTVTTFLTTEPTTSVSLTTPVKLDTTRKQETTVKLQTTSKFRPKEIWIRPAQKGETIDIKTKSTQDHKPKTKKESTEITTPKTIIVSIIPTSVSYVTFKKIALTTSLSKHTTKFNTTSNVREVTKPMTSQTTSPYTISTKATSVIPILQNTKTQPLIHTTENLKSTLKTNSMISTMNESDKTLNSSILTTISSTNAYRRNIEQENIHKVTTPLPRTTKFEDFTMFNKVTKEPVTKTMKKHIETNTSTKASTNFTKTTNQPKDEETFHILTEPEHITAVMSDKGGNKSSVDLISVISIAGGVMMAIITVAVIIVMLERCKRPTYEDVRKYNDVRMQALVDSNDVRPPYVRSIFHTPLPDPPKSDKCHYQPISTLDRNLKQFMRPVVVQTISPLMLENFRGILECHYDHLPRRSHDLDSTRSSVAPSMDECQQLLHQRAYSITDSTIDAMKCEARLDVIDNTTSEPLYAEIPCWRPPSEHAIEIVNLNGEAVTEL